MAHRSNFDDKKTNGSLKFKEARPFTALSHACILRKPLARECVSRVPAAGGYSLRGRCTVSARITEKPQIPPAGGPVKLPSTMPIPVPENRVERDRLELSRKALESAEDRAKAEAEYQQLVLDARGEARRRANLEPIRKLPDDGSTERHEAEMQARLEARRKANLAPTTTAAAKFQGVNNQDPIATINVKG